MAIRGAKPKAARLRLVDGTHNATRHGSKDDARRVADQALQHFGKLGRPKGLKGHALAAWKKYIEPADWLDGSKEPLAIQFCHLWDEFTTCPRLFPASKHGQMRACMSELGLTDERNRQKDDGDEADEFFD